ncbi:MAG TPA: hypothetical protein PLL09_11080 [Flavobacterium sp.]|uniref:hypothetical protein n=2 Tax=Flavobacterium TaxID=237 RepID=UPI0025B907DC|nr:MULTISPECIES: hypothetical protein [unclassified Flavobacterium]HRE78355.1 hypothetical protein [Flavobacterium sp.]
MIKKIKPYLKIKKIDVLLYYMTPDFFVQFPSLDFKIEMEKINDNKSKYFIRINNVYVHKSFLFKKLNLLAIINKKGPAIGECSTINEYKGKSIYPFVINYIARDVLKISKEVFIVVNTDNTSSIRGIEKAGFKLHKRVQAKRFLWFYYNVKLNNSQ